MFVKPAIPWLGGKLLRSVGDITLVQKRLGFKRGSTHNRVEVLNVSFLLLSRYKTVTPALCLLDQQLTGL